jgi:hypothetical protein
MHRLRSPVVGGSEEVPAAAKLPTPCMSMNFSNKKYVLKPTTFFITFE